MPSLCKKYKLLLIALSFLLSLGCKSEDPNPELRDPIYQDLVKTHSNYQKELKGEQKSLESSYKALKKTQHNSVDRAVEKRKIKKLIGKTKKLDQKVRFYAIRVERRRVETRKAYRIAFQNEQPWPDPKEHKAYLVNKKLVDIDLNWNKRVPKLFKKNPNYTPPQRIKTLPE